MVNCVVKIEEHHGKSANKKTELRMEERKPSMLLKLIKILQTIEERLSVIVKPNSDMK